MVAYPNLRARYSKGTLKLRRPLKLADGTEVRGNVAVAHSAPARRMRTRRRYAYPTRPLPARKTGIVALGGDALADSE